MKDYLLFIDTEASGLPKKWYLPYTVPGNWPFAVQVSWFIYSKAGIKISEKNYYISDNDFEICPTALRIHGLTKAFLVENGIPRRQLLAILSSDLLEYRPMIVGHFIELDYHVLGAEYYRAGMDNPMENLTTFCIMTASKHLQQNPQNKFLRLGGLYQLLFNKPLLHQHNAMVDAGATADCFFELVKRNDITNFVQPPIVFQVKEKLTYQLALAVALIIILFSIILIACYYG